MENPAPTLSKPKRRRNGWRGYLIAGLAGLGLLQLFLWLFPYCVLAADLVRGFPVKCDTRSAWNFARASAQLEKDATAADAEAQIIAEDKALDIVQVRTSERNFWVKRQGSNRDGRSLVGYLMAEHRWMEASTPEWQVKPGDVVLDCGAHVGVFSHRALRRGAAKVIAFEIDPTNLECLRRNMKDDIDAGRLVVVAKGVWSAESTMDFTISTMNSGMGSLVQRDPNGSTIQVPLTRIDTVMAELGLARVNFIKMDIEGAERHALAGAAEVLRRFRPTLALDSYHLPDDPEVLPRVIRNANPGYTVFCGPCERTSSGYMPHVLYFR